MDHKSNDVNVSEKVDSNVYDVKREAAEVHLGKRAEQHCYINHFVNARHNIDPAQHNGKGKLNETENHENDPVFLRFFSWRHGWLTFRTTTTESQTHFIKLLNYNYHRSSFLIKRLPSECDFKILSTRDFCELYFLKAF